MYSPKYLTLHIRDKNRERLIDIKENNIFNNLSNSTRHSNNYYFIKKEDRSESEVDSEEEGDFYSKINKRFKNSKNKNDNQKIHTIVKPNHRVNINNYNNYGLKYIFISDLTINIDFQEIPNHEFGFSFERDIKTKLTYLFLNPFIKYLKIIITDYSMTPINIIIYISKLISKNSVIENIEIIVDTEQYDLIFSSYLYSKKKNDCNMTDKTDKQETLLNNNTIIDPLDAQYYCRYDKRIKALEMLENSISSRVCSLKYKNITLIDKNYCITNSRKLKTLIFDNYIYNDDKLNYNKKIMNYLIGEQKEQIIIYNTNDTKSSNNEIRVINRLKLNLEYLIDDDNNNENDDDNDDGQINRNYKKLIKKIKIGLKSKLEIKCIDLHLSSEYCIYYITKFLRDLHLFNTSVVNIYDCNNVLDDFSIKEILKEIIIVSQSPKNTLLLVSILDYNNEILNVYDTTIIDLIEENITNKSNAGKKDKHINVGLIPKMNLLVSCTTDYEIYDKEIEIIKHIFPKYCYYNEFGYLSNKSNISDNDNKAFRLIGHLYYKILFNTNTRIIVDKILYNTKKTSNILRDMCNTNTNNNEIIKKLRSKNLITIEYLEFNTNILEDKMFSCMHLIETIFECFLPTINELRLGYCEIKEIVELILQYKIKINKLYLTLYADQVYFSDDADKLLLLEGIVDLIYVTLSDNSIYSSTSYIEMSQCSNIDFLTFKYQLYNKINEINDINSSHFSRRGLIQVNSDTYNLQDWDSDTALIRKENLLNPCGYSIYTEKKSYKIINQLKDETSTLKCSNVYYNKYILEKLALLKYDELTKHYNFEQLMSNVNYINKNSKTKSFLINIIRIIKTNHYLGFDFNHKKIFLIIFEMFNSCSLKFPYSNFEFYYNEISINDKNSVVCRVNITRIQGYYRKFKYKMKIITDESLYY